MKALTDMGANDYINKLRLEKAITLIKAINSLLMIYLPW